MESQYSRSVNDWTFGRVVRSLALFIDEKFKAQEGWCLNPKCAIVHLRSGVYILHWKELPTLYLVPIAPDEIECPTGFGPLLPAHPPNFDLSGYDLQSEPSFPFEVAYSVSGGPLAGSAGYVKVVSEGSFEDAAMIMS